QREPATVAGNGEAPQNGPGREETTARAVRQTRPARIDPLVPTRLKPDGTIAREHQGPARLISGTVALIPRARLCVCLVPALSPGDKLKNGARAPEVRVVTCVLRLGHVLEDVGDVPKCAEQPREVSVPLDTTTPR